MTIKEDSEKCSVGIRRIGTLCNEGHVKGATKAENVWVIPSDVEKPKDERVKNDKYAKVK